LFKAVALLTGLCLSVFGAVPVLEHFYPVGLNVGSTQTLTLQGKFDPWPPHVWVEGEGLACIAQTNKGKIDVTVDAEAEPGPRLIRVFNDEGASEPRILVIDESWTLAEAEPNNKFDAPQSVASLPMTIDGRLERNGDVDSFRIDLREGQWLVAEAECYTVMGKLDAALRLVSTNGVQLAWNHDFATLDPRLVWRAPAARSVVVQVFGFAYPANSDVQLAGGEGANYRLRVRAESTPPAAPCPEGEREPNGTFTEAAELPLPCQRHGAIAPAGEVDRFKVQMRKGEYIEAMVEAAAIGSALDPRLAIEDAQGQSLAQSEERNMTGNARLEWQAPADGTFAISVRNWQRRGGPEFTYRLRVIPLGPACEATFAAGSLALSGGSTNDVKVAIKRLRGFTNEITLEFTDLPDGLSAAEVKAPEKDGEATLKLLAATNAPPFSGPVQVLCRVAGQARPVPFPLTSRVENNGVPGGYQQLLIEQADHLWLTVRTNAPAAK